MVVMWDLADIPGDIAAHTHICGWWCVGWPLFIDRSNIISSTRSIGVSEKVVIELTQVSSGCSGKIMLTYLSFCRIVEDPSASSLLAHNTSYSLTASLSHQLLCYSTHDSSDEGSLTFIVEQPVKSLLTIKRVCAIVFVGIIEGRSWRE